jgi:hypothetical protein
LDHSVLENQRFSALAVVHPARPAAAEGLELLEGFLGALRSKRGRAQKQDDGYRHPRHEDIN